MSFLAGRLAGKEGAYFFQESKQAVNRLAEKITVTTAKNGNFPPLTSPSPSNGGEAKADILPEVLRHSLPSEIFGRSSLSNPSSLSTSSKWVLPADPNSGSAVSANVLNPLKAYVSLPQVTFGPRRWELPGGESSVLASTANELRRDKYSHVNPEKLKAAAEGLQQIGKAFAVATVIVFGGATLIFGLAASKLEVHNSADIRTRGRDLVNARFETIREQLTPIKTWAENKQKKWHVERDEDIKEKPMVKEISRILGAKTKTSS